MQVITNLLNICHTNYVVQVLMHRPFNYFSSSLYLHSRNQCALLLHIFKLANESCRSAYFLFIFEEQFIQDALSAS